MISTKLQIIKTLTLVNCKQLFVIKQLNARRIMFKKINSAIGVELSDNELNIVAGGSFYCYGKGYQETTVTKGHTTYIDPHTVGGEGLTGHYDVSYVTYHQKTEFFIPKAY